MPGKPDIVLPKWRTVILVHGCFWHMHPGCKYAYMPKSRPDFWRVKLEGNAERDKKNARRLANLGWRVIVVWECELGNETTLRDKLVTEINENDR